MKVSDVIEKLEVCPIVAAVRGDMFEDALNSPAEIIFFLDGSIMNIKEKIVSAHNSGKLIFIHIDLIKGIGKDKCGVEFLANMGADGIISTRAALVKNARELGLLTVQRYFAVDSQGLETAKEIALTTKPDFIEIMPGVIEKVISKFVSFNIPVISGGLIETKAEVTAALNCGAVAVSTGKMELWYI